MSIFLCISRVQCSSPRLLKRLERHLALKFPWAGDGDRSLGLNSPGFEVLKRLLNADRLLLFPKNYVPCSLPRS